MSRHASNVEKIRRPVTVRHLLRAVVFLAGIAAGVALSYAITPQGDTLAFDLGLVQGAVAGSVVGLCLSVLIRLPSTPSAPAAPRPSRFDAMRAELDALDALDGAMERPAAAADTRDGGGVTV